MATKNRIGIMLYAGKGQSRDVLSEDKYKLLAGKMIENNFIIDTINYNDSIAERLLMESEKYNAVIVWVNPVENGLDRQILDSLLIKVSNKGVYVSTHPNTIYKIGTKDVIYETQNMSWGSIVNRYHSFQELEKGIITNLEKYGARIIKPYRGNGGRGIAKISKDLIDKNTVHIFYAERGVPEETTDISIFLNRYEHYFENGNHIIDQEWCPSIKNGMVRCYVTLDKVVGFGYQEINALYPIKRQTDFTKTQPSKRYYYTEACGLFKDLRIQMENEWIPQLMRQFELSIEDMPILWDADFFIDDSITARNKYVLCEINVSSVLPFPDSAIVPIIDVLKTVCA